MTMTLEQLHNWITRLPEPFQPVKRQTDAIEAAIRDRDRLRGDVAGMTEELLHVPSRDDWRELQQRAKRAEAENARLNDALVDISVRLGAEREPNMDDMDWHTDMIARAQYLSNAEAELAALKARIANSPIVEIANYGDPFIVLPDHFTVPNSLKGKRVRLVVEE